jgi:hypothetical protein
MAANAGYADRRPVADPCLSGGEGRPSSWRRLCSHPAVIAGLVTAAGAVVWILAYPRLGTDLAAAIARADWAGRYPGSAYLFSWYGGFHPASYSLLAPLVLHLFGTQLAMAIAAVVGAVLLGTLLARHDAPRPRAAALWVAIALWTELTAGRAAFTLGLAAGLGCVAVADVWSDGRHATRPVVHSGGLLVSTAALALLCSLLSPVAAIFLAVVAAVLALARRWLPAIVITVFAGLPLVVMAMYSDGGVQPILVGYWLPPLLAVAAVLVLVPRRWRAVRTGAVVYGLGIILTWLIPSLLGSNVARLGQLLTGPLLVGLGSTRRRWLLGLALVAAAGWQVAQPIADLAVGNAQPYAPQTAALVRELRLLHADITRVEAVPQYGHWESQELASIAPLARGWERQLDIERNPLFYRGILTPDAYYGWLRFNAVRYVAIGAARPDPAAVAEAAIVRSGQPWLVLVWHDAFWQLYRVSDGNALASPPATVTVTTPAEITLRFRHAGASIVRVRWSPLLQAAGAAVSQAGAWTRVTVPAPGTYVLDGRY